MLGAATRSGITLVKEEGRLSIELDVYTALSQSPAATSEDVVGRLDDRRSPAEVEEGLRRLLRWGVIARAAKARYRVDPDSGMVLGKIQAIRDRNFGFLLAPERDYYLPGRAMRGALHSDVALVRVRRARGRKGLFQGEVVEIVERANRQVIGRFEYQGRAAMVVPSDRRIPYSIVIPRDKKGRARQGQVVVVEIESYPNEWGSLPLGRVAEVLGNEWDPGIEVDIIVREHDLRTSFPDQVLAECKGMSDRIAAGERKKRRDLRAAFTVTIDGLDAKDFDDAVSIEPREGGGWQLGVHIADVSHYVRPGSALMEEAQQRATSVYLVDRVLPMLPEALSNDICSLKPDVERLAFSALAQVSASGEVEEAWLGESVIRSDHRLTYEEVDQHFEGRGKYPRRVEELLEEMRTLSDVLERARLTRGSLNFESIEAKVVLDEAGQPLRIDVRERTPATKLIEETMILTNEVVAEEMRRRELPTIYRIHEEPDPNLVAQIHNIVKLLGFEGEVSEHRVESSELQAILEFADERPERLLINTLLIRSMQQARYSTAAIGHYGLGSPGYTHFTSPIRRLPDLVVHHLLKRALGAASADKAFRHMAECLPAIAEHASAQEREAEAAERESVAVKVCEYMQRHLGDVFDGIVTGVVSFGMFVALPNSAEGLLHIGELDDDSYRYEPEQFQLKGERTGKAYRLGSPVRVRVKKVKVGERQIDFSLVK